MKEQTGLGSSERFYMAAVNSHMTGAIQLHFAPLKDDVCVEGEAPFMEACQTCHNTGTLFGICNVNHFYQMCQWLGFKV